MRMLWTFLLTAALAGCAGAPTRDAAGVQRLYVFNCGESTVADVSRWTPGVNVGQPGEFSANCYLVRHAKGLMLWDSGINESVVGMPGGFQSNKLAPRYILRKTLTAQLAEIGVKPGDITHVAFSHTHGNNHDKAQSDKIPKSPAYIE